MERSEKKLHFSSAVAGSYNLMPMAQSSAIPRYVLYEEPLDDVELAFLHVETIFQRSSLHDWTIRVHAHPDHHQILVLTQGSGTVRLEDGSHEIETNSVVLVSALTVHSFQFSTGADGHVLTVSQDFMRAATENDPDLEALFTGPGRVLLIRQPEIEAVTAAVRELQQEFVWSSRGRRIAIKANLQRILVAVARLGRREVPVSPGVRRQDGEIVVRYRDLVEASFRDHGSVGDLAQRLGVTAGRLNVACRSVVDKSPLTLLHDRMMIEAKRQLLYTSLTVSEIALSLGFRDAAYFSRFFLLRAGTPPGRLRKKAAQAHVD